MVQDKRQLISEATEYLDLAKAIRDQLLIVCEQALLPVPEGARRDIKRASWDELFGSPALLGDDGWRHLLFTSWSLATNLEQMRFDAVPGQPSRVRTQNDEDPALGVSKSTWGLEDLSLDSRPIEKPDSNEGCSPLRGLPNTMNTCLSAWSPPHELGAQPTCNPRFHQNLSTHDGLSGSRSQSNTQTLTPTGNSERSTRELTAGNKNLESSDSSSPSECFSPATGSKVEEGCKMAQERARLRRASAPSQARTVALRGSRHATAMPRLCLEKVGESAWFSGERTQGEFYTEKLNRSKN